MHVHELQQVLWVTTPLGDGIAVLHIDYGVQHNGTLLVALEDGQLKYFDTNQVRVCRNDTIGINVKRRVIANRNINVLSLLGRKGTILEETPDSYLVQFDDDRSPGIPIRVNKTWVDHLQ